ncbi:MAG TPA: DUF1080 domain-containing protein [Chthoniobacteraceae bacterium]|jgi:hypothetical protein
MASEPARFSSAGSLWRERLPMRMKILASAVWMLLALALSGSAADVEFRKIFNGRNLAGWDGDPKLWSVKDGVLRGESSMSNLPLSNTFLIWRGGVLKDFDLRLKFRLRNGNSGVQYRSRDLGKWKVSGYQAEIENKLGKVGFLYEERGRKYLAHVGEKVAVSADGRIAVIGSLGSKDALIAQGYYRKQQWNEYRIVARGNRLEHWLNGYKTIDCTDADAAARSLEGVLALQIHAGPPMLVEFRDILLQSL